MIPLFLCAKAERTYTFDAPEKSNVLYGLKIKKINACIVLWIMLLFDMFSFNFAIRKFFAVTHELKIIIHIDSIVEIILWLLLIRIVEVNSKYPKLIKKWHSWVG